jgi:23S rRNA (adenine2030-N6)-methyltransferase
MNYRHAYHAGNFADVHKHATLALMVEHLKRKDTAFAYIDTHAGIGRYDLASVQAEKTGEWLDGIARIMAAAQPPPSAQPLVQVVHRLNTDGTLRFYPGSPAVAAALARPGDRLVLCELHPEDCAELKRSFAADRRVGVHHRDGYDGLKALLPPPERRGLVLIDPPFEKPGEFERMRQGLAQAMKRWANGLYALWYPIKDREVVARFHADLSMMGLPPTLIAELMIHRGDNPQILNGCGLVVVNPPWQLDDRLAELLPWLAEVLAPAEGGWRVEPLTAP